MRSLSILCLLGLLVLPACDLFDGKKETPAEPTLIARVVLVSEVNVQADDNGKADFLGQVRNVGTATARDVRISVSIFDAAGGLIDVASTMTVPANLESQQIGDFKIDSDTNTNNVVNFEIIIEWQD